MTRTVTLDRAPRAALRREILIDAGDCRDINLSLGDSVNGGLPGEINRAFIIDKIDQLRQLIAALDMIGWCQAPDEPHELAVKVDSDVARWAGGHAITLERCMREIRPQDMDFDALSALLLIAGGA